MRPGCGANAPRDEASFARAKRAAKRRQKCPDFWRAELERRGHRFIHIGRKPLGRDVHPALYPFAAWARARHTAALLPDGRVLVAGGLLNNHVLGSAEIFDPVTSTWSSVTGLVTGRYQHATATLPDGTVMVAGGVDRSIEGLGSIELFTP